MNIEYKIKTASREMITEHLFQCSDLFVPPLATYVSIEEFGRKLFEKAVTFEAWHENKLVGLAAAYFNDFTDKIGFWTNLSLLSEYQNLGIASILTSSVITYGEKNGFKRINLEVKSLNVNVIKFHEKHGFVKTGQNNDYFIMSYDIISK
jgi:ribosomal protein S18 acetylase RimI-like enzyme